MLNGLRCISGYKFTLFIAVICYNTMITVMVVYLYSSYTFKTDSSFGLHISTRKPLHSILYATRYQGELLCYHVSGKNNTRTHFMEVRNNLCEENQHKKNTVK